MRDVFAPHEVPLTNWWNLTCHTDAHKSATVPTSVRTRSFDATRFSASAGSRAEALHTASFIFSPLGKGHPWALACFVIGFRLVSRKQAVLTSLWQTRRRKPKGRSRAGKILSTTRGRENSWGALQAVGVRKPLENAEIPDYIGLAVNLYTAAWTTWIDQRASLRCCVIAQCLLAPMQFLS